MNTFSDGEEQGSRIAPESWGEWLVTKSNKIPLLKNASTLSWLVVTNVFFLLLIAFLAGLYLRFVSYANLERTIDHTHIEDTQRVASIIRNIDNPSQLSLILREASLLTKGQVTLFADSVVGYPTPLTLRRETLEEFRQLSTREFGFSEQVNDAGIRLLSAVVKLDDKEHFLHIQRSEPDVLVFARKDMRSATIFLIIIALIITILASWLASQKITYPLRSISETARRITEGKVDEIIRADVSSSEFQDLSESLNLMANRFRNDIEEWQRLTNIQNEFIGNVSHEVKNPIFSVGGYLEALASANLTAELRQKYVDKGLGNLQRINNLFSDLIEIAKLEYREDLIQRDIFDIGQLLGETKEELEPFAQEKQISIECSTGILKVIADKQRIRQVLTNLIQNAIAYTDHEGGVIRCRYRKHGDLVRIEIVDNGKGIDSEHLGRIFERFYRVDTARSRAMGGTGLGLSIVKQILQAHHQEIHVESTLGRGSRFWFELPFHSSEVVEEEI